MFKEASKKLTIDQKVQRYRIIIWLPLFSITFIFTFGSFSSIQIFFIIHRLGWSVFELAYAIAMVVFYIAFLGRMVYGLVEAMIILRKPSEYFLRGFTVLEDNSQINSVVNKLSAEVGVNIPTVKLVEGEPNAFVYEKKLEQPEIIVSNGVLKKMDDDEIDSLILHELYHVKSGDLENKTFDAILKVLLPRKIAPLLLTCLLLPFVYLFVFGYPPSFSVLNITDRFFLISLWDVATYGTIALFCIFFIITILNLGKDARRGFFHSFYHVELLADAYVALTAFKPAKIRSAILKSYGIIVYDSQTLKGQKVIYTNSIKKRQFSFHGIIQSKKRSSLSSLSSVMKSGALTTEYDKLEKRLEMLSIIHNLVSEDNRIAVLKKENLKLSKPIPSQIAKTVLSNQNKYGEFIDYATRNCNNFNLLRCAEDLSIEPFEVFKLFWAAVTSLTLDLRLD